MIKVEFTPKTDIEQYLNNEFNFDILKDLTENKEFIGLFEPLDFFNIFYEQFEIVVSNSETPILIVKHLNNLELTKAQYYFFLTHLSLYLDDYIYSFDNLKSKQLSICSKFITIEYNKLSTELHNITDHRIHPLLEYANKYSFSKVKQRIEFHSTIKDKIRYLIEIKTDFLQNKDWEDDFNGVPFDEQCDFEIKKLNEILKLNIENSESKEKSFFKNNFDSTSPIEIYDFFKKTLVDKKYLTDEELKAYLKTAFELKTIPKTLFKLKDIKKDRARLIFYVFYKDISQCIHGKQTEYAKLLSNFFEGFDTSTTQTNWARKYSEKSKIY